MLTATYSLVALSVEQENARYGLSALQQDIKHSAEEVQDTDPVGLQSTVDKLSEFEQYCHRRKVEMYIIPAIRKATREADSLLAELDSLSMTGLSILRSVRDRLRLAFEQGIVKAEELCNSMQLYCTNLYQRLVKEEELFQIAQRVISIEEWFAIAAKFLSYDAENDQRKRYAHIRPYTRARFDPGSS